MGVILRICDLDKGCDGICVEWGFLGFLIKWEKSRIFDLGAVCESKIYEVFAEMVLWIVTT